MLSAIISVLFPIFESFWRRLFGGGLFFNWWKEHIKLFPPKLLCHTLNIPAIFSVCYFVRDLNWMWSIAVALTIDCLFWTLSHGPYFDIGRDDEPDVKRYNKMPYHYVLDWLFSEKDRYGHFYDFCGMWIRYTWMLFLLLLVPGFNFGIINLGALVAITYGICHVASEKSLLKKLGSTELAEYVCGFLTGLFLIFI